MGLSIAVFLLPFHAPPSLPFRCRLFFPPDFSASIFSPPPPLLFLQLMAKRMGVSFPLSKFLRWKNCSSFFLSMFFFFFMVFSSPCTHETYLRFLFLFYFRFIFPPFPGVTVSFFLLSRNVGVTPTSLVMFFLPGKLFFSFPANLFFFCFFWNHSENLPQGSSFLHKHCCSPSRNPSFFKLPPAPMIEIFLSSVFSPPPPRKK